MSERSDKVFLRHMLEEAAFVRQQCGEQSYDGFRKDAVLRRAVVRSLEVIGEATKNLSTDLRRRHPHVDWKRMAGLRDVLIHQYFGVDWKTVWNVATEKVPALEAQLHDILEKEHKVSGP